MTAAAVGSGALVAMREASLDLAAISREGQAEQPPLVWWWRDGWLLFSKRLYFSGCFHRPKAGAGICFGPVGQKRVRWVSAPFLS